MNRLAVISGGTQGIGRAIIEQCAQHNFDIITCARSKKDLEDLKTEITSKYSVALDYQVVDMSLKNEVINFAQHILKKGRAVDILVNNVGYFTQGGITDAPEGMLENMMKINLFSAYYLTHGLVKSMKKAKKGHIFVICSVASLASYPDGGVYSVSKFALLGLSKALRQELMECGIKVTAVMPGATRTASWEGTELPDERFILPKDVAESIYGAYALSDQSVVEELIIRPQLGDI